jgi:RNA polymerase sigma-70 factor, ECF subfamily
MDMVLERTGRDLIQACQRGERDSFRVLFELHKDAVYSIALRFTGDPAEAMDIAQETFLKLFSSIKEFRGGSSFESWLYRLVVNRCLDRKRYGRRFLPLVDDIIGRLRSSGENVLHRLLRKELSDRIGSAVARLPPDLRIMIVLRYTQGLSYEEIADALGCARGTVASRLYRAHKFLERRLAPLVGMEGGTHGQ